MARVRVVRGEMELTAEKASGPEIPAVLGGLAAEVSKGDATAVVDGFLDDRELPLIDGNEVTFLFRGGEDVAIAGDMIGMRREEPMNRLEGTDLWWWSTEVDSRARMSYLFFEGDEPYVDPSHDRFTTSTILGPDMNWFRGTPLEMSWFAMPEWPGRSIEPLDRVGGSRLETLKVPFQPEAKEDGTLPEAVEVTFHVWLPPGYDESEERYPTVYLQHGRAIDSGQWPDTLDRVVGRTVAPLIAVFTEWPRLRDYPMSHVVESIDRHFRTRADRASRANIGMSWWASDVISVTFEDPEAFGVMGIQSFFGLEETFTEVKKNIGEMNSDTLDLKIYLEWGKWDLRSPHEEMNMREASRWLYDLLTSKGWEPMGGEVFDSTDFSSWSNRTGAMLQALFPLEGALDTLSVWQTETP
jgi:hypothetical protein